MSRLETTMLHYAINPEATIAIIELITFRNSSGSQNIIANILHSYYTDVVVDTGYGYINIWMDAWYFIVCFLGYRDLKIVINCE